MGRLDRVVLAGGASQEARTTAMKELVRVIGEHPDRFSGFGSVPLGLSHQETGKWIED
jgi:hypothetical protein